jgi:hypothetical protein
LWWRAEVEVFIHGGTLMERLHLLQKRWQHMEHWIPRRNIQNLVFKQKKHKSPCLAASRKLSSMGVSEE